MHNCVLKGNVYLQALLEAGGLVLGVFGNGGVRAATFTRPRLPGATVIPVLISWLLNLSSHLHSMVCIGLHQRFGREQAKVSNKGGEQRQQFIGALKN